MVDAIIVDGAPVQVNTNEAGRQAARDVTILADGSFVIVWFDETGDSDDGGVFMRRYASDGTALTPAVQINALDDYRQDSPSVTALSNGGWAVAYASEVDNATGDFQVSDEVVTLQIYDAMGMLLTTEVVVRLDDAPDMLSIGRVSVTELTNGNLAIQYRDNRESFSTEHVLVANATGQVLSNTEYALVNTFDGNLSSNDVIALDGGGFAVGSYDADFLIDRYVTSLRVFDAAGQEVFSRFKGETYGLDFAELPNGNIAFVFEDGFSASLRLIIYSPDGTNLVGGTNGLDTGMSGTNIQALVLNDGSLLIKAFSFASGDTEGRIFDSNGQALSEVIALDGGIPDVLGSDYGVAVVRGDDSDGAGAFFQLYDLVSTTQDGTPGDDVLDGTVFDDTLNGLEGNDTLNGLDGNDVLSGGTGQNTLNGGDGNDLLILSGTGDTADGGTGDDRFLVNAVQAGATHSISGEDGSDTLDLSGLALGFVIDVDLDDLLVRLPTGEIVLTFTGIENLTGTQASETLRGDSGDNVISGGGGGDFIFGGSGNDRLVNAPGIDVFDGGAGDDILDYTGNGVRTILELTDGTVRFPNGAIETYTGIETILLGSGNDVVYTRGEDILIDGGEGFDQIIARPGSPGLDLTLVNVERFVGSGNNDRIDATGVGEGVKLFGNQGSDRLQGSDFDDFIAGGSGSDVLFGNGGNDVLDGSIGSDVLRGGDGDDIFFVDSNDTLEGGAGYDRIYLRGYSDAANFDVGSSTGIEFASGNLGNDRFIASGSTTAVKLLGQGGDDTLVGGGRDDLLFGGIGDDRLFGGNGDDLLNGSTGADILRGDNGDDRLFIDDTDTLIQGNAGYDRAYAGSWSGAITLDLAAAEIEYVSGSTSGDTFTALGMAADAKIIGRAGDDTLTGGDGDDLIYGGADDDALDGSAGNDFLSGGAGTDSFVFQAGWGADIIADFDDGVELIDISALGITFADLTIANAPGGNAVISYQGNEILLQNIDAADIDASDFIF